MVSSIKHTSGHYLGNYLSITLFIYMYLKNSFLLTTLNLFQRYKNPNTILCQGIKFEIGAADDCEATKEKEVKGLQSVATVGE